ncbi:putative UPF0481 protein At3g02645 [Ananas comosus]|uniref:UPF0481 protein At3g02645 n=1 Tax=Ananas comosus TaxID=4615 RepID=A0A6P5ELK5_ANACO|nr:putative UPF0481 protein At3g02645 [Ananas comosus]
MSGGRWSVPDDIEVGKGGISKRNIEWFEKKLTEADNLFKKGEALLEKIYGDASNGHTIFKCERKGDGREPPEPRAVAIGPYHRNCKNQLKFDDDYKLEITRFMAKYCSLDTKKYLNEMEENEEAVRSCYDKDLSEWSSAEFQMMLLLDSSFILFVIDGFRMRSLEPDYHYVEYMALHLDVREHSEPIKLDLLTVDNQIPFFTIRILLGCFSQDGAIWEEPIEELALCCFDDLWPIKNEEQVLEQDLGKKRNEEQVSEKERKEEQATNTRVPLFLEEQETPLFLEVEEMNRGAPGQFHHLLHLFHWSRIPKEGYQMDHEDRGSRDALQLYIPSATELKKSATKFKKKHSGSSLNIAFNRGLTSVSGVISIPVLQLYDYSKPIFRNLIAFEATPTNSVLCFTAYAACMSCVLQREDDVKLLRERGIVASTNYKDADIVKFFEELNKEIEGVEMPETLRKLYTDVMDHHNSRISKWWGDFMLQFCPNFWVGLSLVAAILIFILSFLQAFSGMLSYYRPKTN